MDQPVLEARYTLERAMKPFALPLGLSSPMWMAYGAAASIGATWWWMSRVSRFVAPQLDAPLNAEASAETPAPLMVAEQIAIEARPAVVEPPAVIASEPVEAPTEATADRPDELTLLRGVGPRVADALVARGVTTFAQLAAWTDHDMAKFDTELKLLGRSKRYDFLGQARELAATV